MCFATPYVCSVVQQAVLQGPTVLQTSKPEPPHYVQAQAYSMMNQESIGIVVTKNVDFLLCGYHMGALLQCTYQQTLHLELAAGQGIRSKSREQSVLLLL